MARGREGAYYAVGNSTLEGRLTLDRANLLDRLALLAAGGAGELTPLRIGYLDRLLILAAGGAGEFTPTRAAALDRLINDLTAARAAGLDELITTGLVVGGTASVPVVRPDLTGPTTVTSGAGGFLMGSWTEIVAAANLAGHVLNRILVRPAGNVSYQIDIGVGGAGAEVSIGRFAITASDVLNTFMTIPVDPALQITANARVAARCCDSGGSASLGMYLCFVPRPL